MWLCHYQSQSNEACMLLCHWHYCCLPSVSTGWPLAIMIATGRVAHNAEMQNVRAKRWPHQMSDITAGLTYDNYVRCGIESTLKLQCISLF